MSGDKTMPHRPQKPTVDIIVTEIVTTHARYMRGYEDSLFGDKTMPHRPQKPMATSTMAQCCPKATKTQ